RPEHGHHAVGRMTAGLPPLPDEWRIETARQIADTIAGTVHDVTRAGGERDIIKVLKPRALEDSLRGADFLAWRDGTGSVRLLARSGNILLMEHAGTVTLRDRITSHGDRDATMIAAAVLTEYHGACDRSPPDSLQPLAAISKACCARPSRTAVPAATVSIARRLSWPSIFST